MNWTEPIRVGHLLGKSVVVPVTKHAIYVVSLKRWQGRPGPACMPLYVGGMTGKSKRFRTRIGDVLIDLLGFHGGKTGHSSGGRSLDRYCAQHGINRLNLWVGWAANVRCGRCAEIEEHKRLAPRLNKIKPPRCGAHDSGA
jgi:hypothetical protein